MSKSKPFSAQDFTKVLGHRFADPDLLIHALTHPSVVMGRTKRRFTDYERLEFLGDRVLGLVVAELLYQTFDQEPEGDLAKRHVSLVRKEALAQVAQTLRLGDYLHLSPGEETTGGRDNPALLADACEAIIGALFLDGGFEVARAFIRQHWTPYLNNLAAAPPKDAKSSLQEWLQAKALGLPVYTVKHQEGPAHNLTFVVEVTIPNHPPAQGRGSSKRMAEQDAATSLLKVLKS